MNSEASTDLEQHSTDDLLILMKRAQEEKNRILAIVYERYAPQLPREGKRMGLSPDEADNALQETILNINRSIERYNPAFGPRSGEYWIREIYRNAIREIRRQEQIPQVPVDPTTLRSVAEGNELFTEKQSLATISCAIRAVEGLTDKQLQVLRNGPKERGYPSRQLKTAADKFRALFEACRATYKDSIGVRFRQM